MTTLKNDALMPSNMNTFNNCPSGFMISREENRLMNDSTEAGKAAHELAAVLLSVKTGKGDPGALAAAYENIKAYSLNYNRGFESSVMAYVDHCIYVYNSVKAADVTAEVLIEDVLPLGRWRPGKRGVVDFAVVGNGELHVIDYKTGNWFESAENNFQLMVYALAILHRYHGEKQIERVFLSIVKPESNTPSNTAEYTPESILAYAEANAERIKGIDLRVAEDDEHCVKCGLRGACKHAAEYHLKRMGYMIDEYNTLTTPDEFGSLLDTLKAYDKWSEDTQKYIKEQMISRDMKVTGYDLDDGNKKNKYTDESAAVSALFEAYGESALALMTPRSFKEITAVIGFDEFKELLEDSGLYAKEQYGQRLVKLK